MLLGKENLSFSPQQLFVILWHWPAVPQDIVLWVFRHSLILRRILLMHLVV